MAVGETTWVVQRGSAGTEVAGAIFGGGGEGTGSSGAFRLLRAGVIVTLGLVEVPREMSGDSEFSFGRVSMTGAIGEGGQSWEMQSMRGVGLGLEI